ncbi:MAG: carboxypeptidase-like regulatory domain-containing protein [Bacteroidales bacterium]
MNPAPLRLRLPLLLLLAALHFTGASSLLSAQEIRGHVVDAETGLPLEFVNIGVPGLPRGTISDVEGTFVLNVEGLDPRNRIRFSLIGYAAREFTLAELMNQPCPVRMERKPMQLREVEEVYQNQICRADIVKSRAGHLLAISSL